jgi:hypothetical protein
LAERLHGMQEARGSNPLSSTRRNPCLGGGFVLSGQIARVGRGDSGCLPGCRLGAWSVRCHRPTGVRRRARKLRAQQSGTWGLPENQGVRRAIHAHPGKASNCLTSAALRRPRLNRLLRLLTHTPSAKPSTLAEHHTRPILCPRGHADLPALPVGCGCAGAWPPVGAPLRLLSDA